ncbi:hypothetical protein BH10ACI3_BH10ACI3_21400 [soil metagenome]
MLLVKNIFNYVKIEIAEISKLSLTNLNAQYTKFSVNL